MEILATIVIITIAAVIFGATRSRRRRNPAEELTGLRSAANLTATIFATSALMHGLGGRGGDVGQGPGDSPPSDLGGSDFGGGTGGGGDFGGGFGGDSGGM